jgi:hypothetical protein
MPFCALLLVLAACCTAAATLGDDVHLSATVGHRGDVHLSDQNALKQHIAGNKIPGQEGMHRLTHREKKEPSSEIGSVSHRLMHTRRHSEPSLPEAMGNRHHGRSPSGTPLQLFQNGNQNQHCDEALQQQAEGNKDSPLKAFNLMNLPMKIAGYPLE